MRPTGEGVSLSSRAKGLQRTLAWDEIVEWNASSTLRPLPTGSSSRRGIRSAWISSTKALYDAR